ncbi:hypothetical protein GCM10010256_50560 [Streptomyces coeruleorubidus]|nr:hypothetical protein GCM10010256_50560 [Streptomyces coeruleorubidus]
MDRKRALVETTRPAVIAAFFFALARIWQAGPDVVNEAAGHARWLMMTTALRERAGMRLTIDTETDTYEQAFALCRPLTGCVPPCPPTGLTPRPPNPVLAWRT